MNPLVAIATVGGLGFAALQMRQASQQEQRNLALQAELVVLEADRQFSEAMFRIAELQVAIAAAQQNGADIEPAAAQLGIAVRQLDSLIVGMNRVGSQSEQLKSTWRAMFDSLCESLLEASFLANNPSGVALSGARDACESS
jgi:hypothetical protein